jgi:hypothetical protein
MSEAAPSKNPQMQNTELSEIVPARRSLNISRLRAASGFRVQGLGFRVSGLGFRLSEHQSLGLDSVSRVLRRRM